MTYSVEEPKDLIEAMEGIVHWSDALNWREDIRSVELRKWIAAGRRILEKRKQPAADPFTDETKTGMFRDHSCTRCNDGAKPCPNGQTGPSRNCEHPHARND